MHDPLPSFYVMSSGWEYTDWIGGFYPEDLPQEWRLTYYANEFPGVLIPQHIWTKVDYHQLASWAQDVGENFRFFLELNQAVDLDECQDKSVALGFNAGGFVVSSTQIADAWLGRFTSLNQYAGCKLYLSIDAVRLPSQMSHLLKEGLDLALFINGAELPDLRGQRNLLEQLSMQIIPGAQVPLFIKGHPPSIGAMRQLGDLIHLMGLA